VSVVLAQGLLIYLKMCKKKYLKELRIKWAMK
jgi:hypothetical protein